MGHQKLVGAENNKADVKNKVARTVFKKAETNVTTNNIIATGCLAGAGGGLFAGGAAAAAWYLTKKPPSPPDSGAPIPLFDGGAHGGHVDAGAVHARIRDRHGRLPGNRGLIR